jgi:hypothetical protein
MSMESGFLEGIEPHTVPEITQAAEAYQKAKEDRVRKLSHEIQKHDALMALMKTHDLKIYRDGDLTVTVVDGKEKVKVKRQEDDDDD